jgi:hypothetical protein
MIWNCCHFSDKTQIISAKFYIKKIIVIKKWLTKKFDILEKL